MDNTVLLKEIAELFEDIHRDGRMPTWQYDAIKKKIDKARMLKEIPDHSRRGAGGMLLG